MDFIGRPDHIEGGEEALLLGPGVQWGIVPSEREEGSERMVVIPHEGHKIHITAKKKKNDSEGRENDLLHLQQIQKFERGGHG